MAGRPTSRFWSLLCLMLLVGVLAGCSAAGIPKDLRPVPRALQAAMHDQDMADTAPIFIRIFKEDSQLEVWKQKGDGTYGLLKSYAICQWSGELGPKKVEGDYQAPEGFYTVTPSQMNPNSDYYLSFNIGYPNAYDQSLGRTGGNLMVHGACSSAGCYSMTDESAGEIFALARDAFRGGQREFQIQAFPFRMTPENMAKHYDNPNIDFWKMLKVGYDAFDLTHTPPKVDVCDQHYVFDADAGTAKFDASAKCPAYRVPEPIATALANRKAADDAKFAATVVALKQAKGSGGTSVATVQPAVATAPAAGASRPSILSRFGGARDPSPASTGTVAPASIPASSPAASVAAARPVTPAPKTSSAPAIGAKPAGGANDPIGVLIDRKFWWDDAPPAKPAPGST
jgi:murein L,D-transpeptidase YafK